MTGSKIVNEAQRSLTGITKNFTDQQILGTVDDFSDTSGFKASISTGSFDITELTEYNKSVEGEVALENIPSLFGDRRFSHMPNFTYLPPVNMAQPGTSEKTPMGVYPKLNEREDFTLLDLENHLQNRPSVEVNFSDTSRDNNIIGQVFEFDTKGIEKLSIVDFGEFADNDPFSPGKRVFFVGKILKDDAGSETFLNIFTLVFD